jgi:uncharacterized membrane protein
MRVHVGLFATIQFGSASRGALFVQLQCTRVQQAARASMFRFGQALLGLVAVIHAGKAVRAWVGTAIF